MVSTVRQDLTSDGSEFQVCGAATEKDRRANSVCVFGTISSMRILISWTVSEWSTSVTDRQTDILAYSIMPRFTMPSAETPSRVHWRRFYFQLTRVRSALKPFGRCALQTYLLTYLLIGRAKKENVGDDGGMRWSNLLVLSYYEVITAVCLPCCVHVCGPAAIKRSSGGHQYNHMFPWSHVTDQSMPGAIILSIRSRRGRDRTLRWLHLIPTANVVVRW